jgi:hypothetical protein
MTENDSGYDWKAVAEGLRSCLNCGHAANAHSPDEPKPCWWRYFSFFRRCRCRSLQVGNIWPPITIGPGETVTFEVDLFNAGGARRVK